MDKSAETKTAVNENLNSTPDRQVLDADAARLVSKCTDYNAPHNDSRNFKCIEISGMTFKNEDLSGIEAHYSKFKDCELTECEKPENAQIISAEPNINPAPFIMHNPYYDLAEPGVRNTIYDGPNCAKCANRFRRNDWCNQHFRNTGNCYRFKYKP